MSNASTASARPRRGSDDLYLAMLEAAQEGIWQVDSDLVTRYVNPFMAGLLGRDQDRVEGSPAIDCVVPGLREDVERHYGNRREGRADRYETELLRGDGTRLWVRISSTPVYDTRGEFDGAFAIVSDISSEREALQALERREREYLTLLESVPDVIARFDRDLRQVYANPAADRTFDAADRSKRGLRPREMGIPKADVEVWEGALRKVFETGSEGRVVFSVPGLKGSRWFQSRIVPERSAEGTIETVLEIIRDVTDIKRAEEELRRKSHDLAERVKESRCLYAVSDVLNRWTEEPVDVVMERVLAGLPDGWRRPVIARARLTLDGRTYASPGFRPTPWSIVATIGSNGSTRGTIEVVYLEAPVAEEEEAFIPEEVELLRAVAQRIDEAMKRRIAEMDRRELEGQLHQAQKMEAVGRLAGGVAHDFNNALTVIRGHGELICGATEADSPLHESAREIQEAAERATMLTRRLLAFSKRQMVEPQRVDVNGVVGDMRKMLGRLIGEDVHLVTETEPGLPVILADPGQIEQVLMNLVVNARDAVGTGGTIAVRTRRGTCPQGICGTGEDADGCIVIEVEDDGIGMAEETAARVFEPFFTTKAEGTGLGLSIVYGIVEQSRGRVEVESAVGGGTTFRAHLPAVSGESEPAAEAGPPQDPTGSLSGRVLLVEDDTAVRDLSRRILERTGLEVIASACPSAAIEEMAKGIEVDLLLTDVVMPEMSGQDLADRLRLAHPGLVVLFMSGYAQDERVLETVERDPRSHFLPKPFSPASLIRAVAGVLAG